jgi:acetyltransferase-like isoleucine patch superfamily enzyme
VTIGNYCYIGSHIVIAKGVEIGDHCVVGACSFVNRSVLAFSIAVSTPTKTIGRVEVNDDQVRLIYETE